MPARRSAETKPYRFLLRMPEELRDELLRASGRNDSSLNGEIVRRLAASVADERRATARRRGGIRAAVAAAAAATMLGGAAAVGTGDGLSERDATALQLRAKLAHTSPLPPR